MSEIILSKLNSKITELENHPLYSQITCLDSLRFFMERHVFAVFDFMSLTKGLQGYFAPINKIWTPPKNRELARFINEIVLGEESDITPDGHYMSHFELYILAMNEVNANPTKVLHLADNILTTPLAKIDSEISIPNSALNFMNDTFAFIEEGSIHKIASAKYQPYSGVRCLVAIRNQLTTQSYSQ